jgi:hypothetical protein
MYTVIDRYTVECEDVVLENCIYLSVQLVLKRVGSVSIAYSDPDTQLNADRSLTRASHGLFHQEITTYTIHA